MAGLAGRPTTADGKKMQPLEVAGVKVMSMGFLVEEETPMIWRGPMVQSALQQMLGDVDWGELDVLVLDLPPGTGPRPVPPPTMSTFSRRSRSTSPSARPPMAARRSSSAEPTAPRPKPI